jgi:hypothetical protein
LTVVERRVLECNGVDVSVGDGCHLRELDGRDSAIGIQDEDGDGGLRAETVDCGTTDELLSRYEIREFTFRCHHW